jgi:hypothetical protein
VPSDDKGHYEYVFVYGLQRSETTVLGRNIARLGSGVPVRERFCAGVTRMRSLREVD